jgi:F5/8 type C domain
LQPALALPVLAALLLSLPSRAVGANLPRASWLVYATSSENAAEQHPASIAIDGATTTFWHSFWTSPADQLPHSYTINFAGGVNSVTGLTYTPRQDGTKNGNIGKWQVWPSTTSHITCALKSLRTCVMIALA